MDPEDKPAEAPAEGQVPDEDTGAGEDKSSDGASPLSEAVAPDDALDLDLDDELEVTREEAPKKEGEKEPKPAPASAPEDAPPAPTSPADKIAGEEPAAPPAKGAPPEAQPAPAAASPGMPPPPTMEELRTQFSNWRSEAEELLSQHHYALSEEQVQQLRDDGVPDTMLAAIPRAMSRVYLDAVTATMTQITTYLPQMMGMVVQQQEKASKEETEFFGAWPKLAEHRETVVRIGAAYRQAHPQASKEQFIKEVGASAMVSLQLPIEGNTNSGGGTAKAPPFKPAAAKGTPARTPPPPENEFEKLNREFEEEETLDVD